MLEPKNKYAPEPLPWLKTLAWLLVFSISSSTTVAQQKEIVEKGKAATALVDLAELNQSGTAWCVDSSGVFVTNHHVIADVAEGGDVPLVLDSSTKNQRVVTARVERIDQENDLAILRTVNPGNFPALALGDDSALFETQSVLVFGFPFGKGLAVGKGKFPSISVNKGAVTALRKDGGVNKLIQFDADVNPGNSGGPVCNEDGQVVAVVSSGFDATAVNFGIPAGKVTALLTRPTLDVTYPVVTANNAGQPAMIRVKLVTFQSPLDDVRVEVGVRVNQGKEKNVRMVKEGADYVGRFTPVFRHKAALLILDLHDDKEIKSIQVSDKRITVGARALSLSEVETIRRAADGNAVVTLHTGSKLKGRLDGVSAIADRTGKRHDLLAARQVDIRSSRPDPQVDYRFVVRSGGKVVAEKIVRRGGRGMLLVHKDINSQPYRDGRKTIKLPSDITDVVRAKAGELLILELREIDKLAVFDTNMASIVATIPLPKDAIFAAGLEYIIIVDQKKGNVEQWSLTSYNKERTARFPLVNEIDAASIGYSSQQPMIVRYKPVDGLTCQYAFIDQISLEQANIEYEGLPRIGGRQPVVISSNSFGNIFAVTFPNGGISQLEFPMIGGNQLSLVRKSARGDVALSPAGFFFTSRTGVTASPLSVYPALRPVGTPGPCIPCLHPRLFLVVPGAAATGINRARATGRPDQLWSLAPMKPVANLPDLGLGEPPRDTPSKMTVPKRVHYIPWSGMIVSIPFDDREILVQGFDPIRQLALLNEDTAFVLSVPPVTFTPGEEYAYRCRVLSTRGDVRYSLKKGPDGMRIRNGVVQWKVPENFNEARVRFTLEITDSSGQLVTDDLQIFNAAAE